MFTPTCTPTILYQPIQNNFLNKLCKKKEEKKSLFKKIKNWNDTDFLRITTQLENFRFSPLNKSALQKRNKTSPIWKQNSNLKSYKIKFTSNKIKSRQTYLYVIRMSCLLTRLSREIQVNDAIFKIFAIFTILLYTKNKK